MKQHLPSQKQIPWFRKKCLILQRCCSEKLWVRFSHRMRDRLSAKSWEYVSGEEKNRVNVCERGTEDSGEVGTDLVKRGWNAKRREKEGSLRFLRRSRNTGLCGHLSCSRCASCSGWGTGGVQRALLLWRNLTRPRKSSAAYSTQHSGLIASLAFPVTKSHPSATQGRDHNNKQLSPFLCLLLWYSPLTVEQYNKQHTLSAGLQLSRCPASDWSKH